MAYHAKQHYTETQSFVYFIAAIAALCGLLFGFDTGVISGAILFVHKDFALTTAGVEAIVSAVLLGALSGAVLSGRVTDTFGRRSVIIVVAVIFALGSLWTAMAEGPISLGLGRIVVGFAIGIASYTAPLYISEIAPYNVRGMLVSLNQLCITVGIVLSYVVDYAFTASEGWRWMFGMGVFPAIILFVGMLFLPESPRFMILKGKDEKARKTLKKIRGTENIEDEVSDIKETLSHEQGTWSMLFSKRMTPVILIGALLMIFSQADGINTIIYYAPVIFKMSGFEGNAAAILATLGVGIVNVIFTIIALPLFDRWGRRPLLFIGIAAMAISLILLGYAFKAHAHLEILRWVSLGSLILYIAGFAISLGPISWLLASEIFPLGVRGLGMSLVTACNWGSNLIVALTFLTLLEVLGAGHTFWLFGGLSVVTWLFVLFFIPETKGVSLEQIEANIQAGKSTRHLGEH